MTTVREEFRITCSDCASDADLEIEIAVWTRIHGGGSEIIDGDHLWDDGSPIRCVNCQRTGTVKEFSDPAEATP